MKDGGFVVVWDDDTANLLRGLRCDKNGAAVGVTFTIAAGGAISEPELGLAGDGRILVTFENAAGGISQVILDPRDNVINGDNAVEIITSRIDGATVNGLGGNDTLLGQGAVDKLYGGLGADVLKGTGGGDTLDGDGIDVVQSSVSFNLAGALGAVEKLVLRTTPTPASSTTRRRARCSTTTTATPPAASRSPR